MKHNHWSIISIHRRANNQSEARRAWQRGTTKRRAACAAFRARQNVTRTTALRQRANADGEGTRVATLNSACATITGVCKPEAHGLQMEANTLVINAHGKSIEYHNAGAARMPAGLGLSAASNASSSFSFFAVSPGTVKQALTSHDAHAYVEQHHYSICHKT